ncbi:MAG: hypothetical protein ACKVQB_06945 [Bacteroidia bacterium]
MNKAFKLLFALLISLPGLAQNSDSARWDRFKNQFDNPFKKIEAARIIGFQSNTMLSANRISNNFIYPFVFGKKLEKETIDNMLDNSKNKLLNIETNNELRFVNLEKNLFKKPTLNWYIKGGTHRRTFVNATNDAATLVFRGNTGSSSFQFDNCNYYNLQLNKIGVGLFHHNEKTARPYNLSFGLFVIQALNYASIKTYQQNFLKGNEDSFNIGINYDAAFASADAFGANGMGLGGELIFNQKINNKSIWGFRLENFGFARFNESTTTYTGFGQYKFDGVFIAEIGRLNEENYFQNRLDSFTNPFTNKKENQTKTVWIAPSSFVYYTIHSKRNYYQIGLRHSGTKALPVAEFRYFTFVKPKLIVGATAGAIGQYYLNTDINWAINRQWFFQAAIYHVEAIALPKTFGGLGGGFGLQFVF